MRPFTVRLALAGIAALLISACGGGGVSGGSSGGGTSNQPPTANAGAAQTVDSGVTVTLNGSASSDSDGSVATYAWTQSVGGAVALSSSTAAQPTFTAPAVGSVTTLTFSLVVTDNRGATSTASTVNVTVNPPANSPPIANAGLGASVASGTQVNLNGALSTDPDGVVASYSWTQTAGTAVVLSSTTGAQPAFTAPSVTTAATLSFSLVVTDNQGSASPPSAVDVVVNPVTAENAVVKGTIRFARAPFTSTSPFGLNYGFPGLQPARGVLVRLINANTQAELASGSTDSFGQYSLVVPANTSTIVRVVAQMLRDANQPLPRWNVRVQDGLNGTPYFHNSTAVNSGAGVTKDVDIPLGIDASGVATGTRASGPFAILDTIFTAQQTVIGVSPSINFPALVVDWGSQIDGTFFSTQPPQHISLLSDLTEDTDEFDQHVVAHEFGHYLEQNFSRADNIGGAHGLGDRLDARVAFGEGFGYAFAAIVMNDPNARDSFVNPTPINGTTLVSGGFNVETNPTTNPPGANRDREGCWCSESSIWSILYDIHDSSADTNDTMSLGFAPIWNVLIGQQKTTPAFTTVFSFISALKAARPNNAVAINTLVAAQNIDAVSIDAFATNETHFPSSGTPSVAQAAALPLYTSTTVGSAAKVLRNVDDAGNYNKLGNHRFVRFNLASARQVTVTLATSNANTTNDPDFLIYKAGEIVASGENGPPGPETNSFSLPSGDYVVDIYDCANGCSNDPSGTPGDYDLTLTIN